MGDSFAGKVELCNMALGHFAGGSIISLTENSREADACNTYFDAALDFVLGDHDWKFASTKKKAVAITPGAVNSPSVDDMDGWLYLYTYPPDCAKMREVLTASQYANDRPFGYGSPFGAAYGPEDNTLNVPALASNSYTLSGEAGFGDQRGPEIPYNVASIGSRMYIFCDVPEARIRYTKRLSGLVKYPPDFALAFSFFLASLMCYKITRRAELTSAMAKLYKDFIGPVKANDSNEAPQIMRDPPAPWVRARGGD